MAAALIVAQLPLPATPADSATGGEVQRPVLLSRPRLPAHTKYYPPGDLLGCVGENFSAGWRDFRFAVDANARAGFPRDSGLLAMAKQIHRDWEERSLHGSIMQVRVLLRFKPVHELEDFCLFGYASALFVLFRHEFNQEHLFGIEAILGWDQWPLDFAESSGWPAYWRILPLHLEQARRRGDVSWSEAHRHWGEEGGLLPRPQVLNVEFALRNWLQEHGAAGARDELTGDLAYAEGALEETLARGRQHLRVLVAGHHMGSSMEPYTMLRRAIGHEGITMETQFHGQRHPAPNIMCDEFGYCNENQALGQWFRRYESRWVGEYDWMLDHWSRALNDLAEALESDSFLSNPDFVVCGGPAWFCSMFRIVRPTPMLLYFAWPIVPMVPQKLRAHVLAHIQALGRTREPATVMVCANWLLAAQFALQTRLEVPVLRPHGLYVNQSYNPVPAPNGFARVLFSRLGQWTTQAGPAFLELIWGFVREEQRASPESFPFEFVFLSIRVRGIDPILHVNYADMAQFHACVFFPWDIMMLLFDELYTMTMPLLVPERRWMHNIMMHALTKTEVNWWHMREGNVAGWLPAAGGDPFPLPTPWLGDQGGVETAAFWYELTDFVQFPQVTHFDSVPDLLLKLKAMDVREVRRGMRAFNAETLDHSLAFYRRAAGLMLASRA